MPRLTDKTKLQRREQISSAALRCFARQGFAETSMADIVAESGLSAGSIYSHYDSKVELIRVVAADVLHGRVDLFAEAVGEVVTPAEALQTFMEDIINPDLARVLVQVWAEVARDEALAEVAVANLQGLREMLADTLAAWIDETSARENRDRATLERQTVDAVLACTQGYIVRIALERDLDAAALRTSLVASLSAR